MKQVVSDIESLPHQPEAKRARRSPSPDPGPRFSVPASIYFLAIDGDRLLVGMWRWNSATSGTSAGELYEHLKMLRKRGDIADFIDAALYRDEPDEEKDPDLPDGWDYADIDIEELHSPTEEGYVIGHFALEGEVWMIAPSEDMLSM
jgi:hypothetical protein